MYMKHEATRRRHSGQDLEVNQCSEPNHNLGETADAVEAVDMVDVTQMAELLTMQRLVVIFIGCSC
jgi:hypothetical protein